MSKIIPAPLVARASATPLDAPADSFMWMPAGSHAIGCARLDGEHVDCTLLVDPAAAQAMQRQLEALRAKHPNQRPYCDFDHADGPASFWPEKFEWRETPAPGIYVTGQWSDAGAAAIQGRTYRAFSPEFFVDDPAAKPARIICAEQARLNMGGLVNDPAFKAIAPLWAKASNSAPAAAGAVATAQQQTNKHNTSMPDTTTTPAAAADSNAALQAKDQEIVNLKQAIQARNKADADAAVQAAVQRGAIPAANTALQARWAARLTEKPEDRELLDTLPDAAALQARAITAGKSSGVVAVPGPLEILKAFDAIQARQRAVKGHDAAGLQAKAAVAREAAAFYAREIRAKKDLLDMPLQAAYDYDNLGTLTGTLVIQRTLELFRINYPLFKSVYTDFSDQPAYKGQTIATRIISKPSVQTYTKTLGADGRPGGWDTASAATTTDATTSIDEHVGVPMVFSSDTLAATPRRLFDEQAPAMSYALSAYFVAKIYALMTAARFNGYAAVSGTKVPVAYATYAKGVGDFARSAAVELNAIFNRNEVPLHERALLLNPDYFAALGKDPSLTTFWAAQRNPEIITEGELPRMSKFVPIEAPDFPASADRVGFALQKNAIIALARIPTDYTQALPGASYGNVSMVTDPETGLTVMLVQYVNHTAGYAEMRMETMIGAGVGDKRAGLVLTSK